MSPFRHFRAILVAACIVGSGVLCGQLPAQVTVQLPTYNVTGVSTTVLVPDRGSVYLGGINNSSLRSRSYGNTLGNRALSRTTSADSFWASATIIDHAELDRAVLAEAQRRQRARLQPRRSPKVETPRPRVHREGQAALTATVTETDRVGVYLTRAERAEADGQPQVAKIFYQRIAKHGTVSQQKLAERRLAAIESNRER